MLPCVAQRCFELTLFLVPSHQDNPVVQSIFKREKAIESGWSWSYSEEINSMKYTAAHLNVLASASVRGEEEMKMEEHVLHHNKVSFYHRHTVLVGLSCVSART